MARTRSAGGISVRLLADDSDFNRRLRNASRTASRRAKEMRAAFNAVGGAMLKAGTVAGGAMAAGIALANKRIDAMAKHADKISIATEKLQSLRFAAEQTGVASGTLDTALQRMVRRVSEAGKGSGPAAKAIAELGLSAKELAKLSPDKQFRELTLAMSGVATQGDRVRLAMALFDTEGVALVNTMAMGVEGLDAMEAKLARYGVAISRLDAAKVEQVNDAWGELQMIHKGFWDQMAVQASGTLSELAEKTLEAVDELGGMGNVAERVMGGMVTAGGYVGDVIWGWSLAITQAQIGIAKLSLMLEKKNGFISGLASYADNMNLVQQEAKLKGQAQNELWNEGKLDRFYDKDDQKNQILLQDRIEKIRKEQGIALPSMPDDPSREIISGLEQLIPELQAKMDSKISDGMISDRIQKAFADTNDKWESRAAESLDEKKAKSEAAAIASMGDVAGSSDKTAKALDKLSASAIASAAFRGSNKQLAKRHEELTRLADGAEATGRFDAADRYRQRAEELDGRIKRRPEPSGQAHASEVSQVTSEVNLEGKTEPAKGGDGFLASIDRQIGVLVNEIMMIKVNLGIT